VGGVRSERVRREREAAALAETQAAAAVEATAALAAAPAAAVVEAEKSMPPSLVSSSTPKSPRAEVSPYTVDKVVNPASQKWRTAIHSVKGTWRGLTAFSTGNAPLRPGTLTAPAAAPESSSSPSSSSKPMESLADLLAKARVLNASASVVAAFKLGVSRVKRVRLTEREAALLILGAFRRHRRRRLKSGVAALLSPVRLTLPNDFFKPQRK